MPKKQALTALLASALLCCIGISAALADNAADFSGLTLVQLWNNADLKKIALAKGAVAYKKNCATCHGEDGTGNTGVSDLTNGVWLWGSALSDIEIDIRYGIRSGHPLQRFSEMPPYKDYTPLQPAQIDDLVQYVLSISMQEADAAAVQRASGNFENICAECHNYGGTGRAEYYGAPDLTDFYWLYGEGKDAIRASINDGRKGVSPAFEGKLDNATIKMLTIYVYSLSHQ